MIPLELEQVLLAVVTGASFGYIIYRFGSTPERLLFILVSLWLIQSGSQFVYRALAGIDVLPEVLAVGVVRAVFTASAVFVLWRLNRRELP